VAVSTGLWLLVDGVASQTNKSTDGIQVADIICNHSIAARDNSASKLMPILVDLIRSDLN
jgi:hypothetical protein